MNFLFPALSFGVLLTSFAGSLHCVGMCGGLVVSVVRTRRESVLYHVGRLISYLTLGSIAGLIGQQILLSPLMRSFQLLLSFFVFLFFTWMAYQVWNQRSPHLSVIPASLLLKIQKWSLDKSSTAQLFSPAFLIGLSSGLLPCGWLHTFVIAATTSGGPVQGAAILLFFWIGTVPALASSGLIAAKLSGRLKEYSAKILAIILLLLGSATLAIKVYPVVKLCANTESNAEFSAESLNEVEKDSCPLHIK